MINQTIRFSYALIGLCLVEENRRPEMTRLRSLLCHSKMLSKSAFEYYRVEYNRYQEENSTDENVERFGDDQGVTDLPTFDNSVVTLNENNIRHTSKIEDDNIDYLPDLDELNPLGYYEPRNEMTSQATVVHTVNDQRENQTMNRSNKQRSPFDDSYM